MVDEYMNVYHHAGLKLNQIKKKKKRFKLIFDLILTIIKEIKCLIPL